MIERFYDGAWTEDDQPIDRSFLTPLDLNATMSGDSNGQSFPRGGHFALNPKVILSLEERFTFGGDLSDGEGYDVTTAGTLNLSIATATGANVLLVSQFYEQRNYVSNGDIPPMQERWKSAITRQLVSGSQTLTFPPSANFIHFAEVGSIRNTSTIERGVIFALYRHPNDELPLSHLRPMDYNSLPAANWPFDSPAVAGVSQFGANLSFTLPQI